MSPDSLEERAVEIVSDEEFDALVARAKAAKEAESLPKGDPGRKALSERPRAYIGFEPSGTAHIGWVVCTETIRQLVDTGFDVTILLADWHAQINDKLGGDLHAIHRCAEYMTDAFEAMGVEKDSVTYRFARELTQDPDYWATVIQVSKHTTLARMRRAMSIMGRKEEDADADMSKFIYPAMQVADIFYMDIDLAYGGLDQRHAHMLARDVAKKIGKKAPVAYHTALVPNLKGGAGRMDPAEAKMSKSDPSTGIFLHDDRQTVERKIAKAHCPAGETEDNPVLEMLRLVICANLDGSFTVEREQRFGGPLEFDSFSAVETAFVDGDLHPKDMKDAVAAALNEILDPIRAYFEKHPENLAFIEGLKRTR